MASNTKLLELFWGTIINCQRNVARFENHVQTLYLQREGLLMRANDMMNWLEEDAQKL
jgi:hypothetical protein